MVVAVSVYLQWTMSQCIDCWALANNILAPLLTFDIFDMYLSHMQQGEHQLLAYLPCFGLTSHADKF